MKRKDKVQLVTKHEDQLKYVIIQNNYILGVLSVLKDKGYWNEEEVLAARRKINEARSNGVMSNVKARE